MSISFYLSGVMQGSRQDDRQVDQNYRQVIKNMILTEFSDARVVCPADLFSDISFADNQTSKSIVPKCAEIAANCDVVVAFLPEASMGTAVELWEAHKELKLIITISPMKHNLMLRSVSDLILSDLEEFEQVIKKDGFMELINKKNMASIF